MTNRGVTVKWLVCLALLLPAVCWADPTITDVSGTIADGEAITITGTSFGATGTPGPVGWNKFDQGTDGEVIGYAGNDSNWVGYEGANSNVHSWCLDGQYGTGGNIALPDDLPAGIDREAFFPTYSDSFERISGSLSIRNEYWRETIYDIDCDTCAVGAGPRPGENAASLFFQGLNGVSENYYITFWMRSSNRDSLNPSNQENLFVRNKKIITRDRDGQPARAGWWEFARWSHVGTSSRNNECGYTDTYNVEWAGAPSFPDAGAWHRVELYLDEGSINGQEIIQMWYDGADYGQGDNSYGTPSNDQSGDACIGKDIKLGYYHDWFMDERGEDMWRAIYFDDVYVDSTQARVELGNSNQWETCTHREIQVPTSWGDTELSVTINAGTFVADDDVYLYVVDREGNVNATGYELLMGGEGQPGGGAIAPCDSVWVEDGGG